MDNPHGPTEQLYMGTAEVARYRRVSSQAVTNWRARGKLPPPAAQLKMGPVWVTEEIVAWFRNL